MERILVTGVVQGVGFRPFVHRLANELGCDGLVGNDGAGVFIEASGSPAALDEFTRRLVAEAPPLASIESVVRHEHPGVAPGPGFVIAESRTDAEPVTLVPPDTAVCAECLAEFRDPDDRRFGHPFITCTNCGPRFTIIERLPYDRPNTTMAGFPMCAACAAEYHDPTSRRHHAQPIGCHDCGPRLTGDPTLLADGKILAVKSLGGFHLVCDATDASAVALLRERKHRPDKPLAVMVADLDMARRVAVVSSVEAELLESPARPIVLLRSRPDSPIASNVAPDNPMIGVMLPSTPVHHLLFDTVDRPLVTTSGNLSGEPICHVDGDTLDPFVDGYVTNDRPIHLPCDDSVVRVVAGSILPIRRARGYAPLPVTLPMAGPAVLAVGGELKNTFTVTSGARAWVSPHIGDMENLATLQAFESRVEQFCDFYRLMPELVVVDAHPGYRSSTWARSRYGEVVEVQHHEAHIAAVMAEHRLPPDTEVLGFAFDGTGYGTDGTIWGGEVFAGTVSALDRVAHLAPVPLPGGDAAIRHPVRTAFAHLRTAGIDWPLPIEQRDRALLERQLDTGFGCVPTTSMGRLFDAVAALLGLRSTVTFEAQAAIDLEVCAEGSTTDRTYPFGFDSAPLLQAIVDDLRAGVPIADIAMAFHRTVVDAMVAVALDHSIGTVVLSGGVFQNALLVELASARLGSLGFEVLTHRLVPPNDGGLSLGQAYLAIARHQEV